MLYVRIFPLFHMKQGGQHSPCDVLLNNLFNFWKFSCKYQFLIMCKILQKNQI